jgi:D-inositol-3-phosphate glycosyltransferase
MLSYHTCPLATLGGKDTGGMNVYVRELTRYLGQRGVQVDVFTRSQDEHVPHVLHDLGYGNRVVHVPAGPETPLSKVEMAGYLPQFVEGICDFAAAKGLKYDLIHSHYWMSGIAARDLKAAWNIPVVHMFHTLGLMKQRVARTPGEAEGDYRLEGEKEVLRLADRIVAATPAELAQLQWLYQADTRKVVIIPPGVDISRFYPIHPDEAKEVIGVPPCDKTLLFVGRIEPLKGVDTLIQAICLMQDKRVYVCLVVIGGDVDSDTDSPNDEMERLKTMREQAGLQDLVTFLGKRSQDTLPYYYSAAEAVVVPSHYESFGMVALEAMACGTPVVASQVGGLAFLVRDGVTGYTVPVDEPQALADRLTALVQDSALRHKLGEQALQEARQYAWENIAARMIELYQQVLDSANGESPDFAASRLPASQNPYPPGNQDMH